MCIRDSNRMDIGFRSERDSGFSTGGGVADVPQESLMLTGDENIVNIDFSVFWVIKDAGNFLFKIQDPEGTVKAAAETAMREVIAKSDIQPILTEGRAKIELETQEIIQSILDEYGALLDDKTMTPTELGMAVAEHSLNATNIDLIGLASTGVEYMI